MAVVKSPTSFRSLPGYTGHHRRYGEDMALDPDTNLDAVAILADEQRRKLYGLVRHAHRPVTREEVAEQAGVSAKLAAFHLDKLVDAGLLRAHYASPDGVPRVGRKPKVYEVTATHIRVSLPERRAEVIAGILVDAVAGLDAPAGREAGQSARAAALDSARRRGEEIGAAARAGLRPGRLGAERSVSAAESILEDYGYEPVRVSPTGLRLLNCPFHEVVDRAPDLVCGLNRDLIAGVLDGMRCSGIEAVLAPAPGQCCVELRRAAQPSPGEDPPPCCAAGHEDPQDAP